MKSALYSNIVYPIRRHGEYIAHYTPGKDGTVCIRGIPDLLDLEC